VRATGLAEIYFHRGWLAPRLFAVACGLAKDLKLMLQQDRPDARIDSVLRLGRAQQILGRTDFATICALLIDDQATLDGAPVRDRIGSLRTLLASVASLYGGSP